MQHRGGDVFAVLSRLALVLGAETESNLASKLDVKRSTLSSWKSRGKIPLEECNNVAQRNNVSLEWIVNGVGPRDKHALEMFGHTAWAPLRYKPILKDFSVLFGPDETPRDDPQRYSPVALEEGYLKEIAGDQGTLQALYVSGDEMSPFVPENSWAIIAHREGQNALTLNGEHPVISGEIYMVAHQKEDKMRRVWVYKEKIVLECSNRCYPLEELYFPIYDFMIWGRVVWVGAPLIEA